MKNLKIIIFTIVLFYSPMSYSQNDTLYKSIICDFPKLKSTGLDSLNRKQGYWTNQDTCIYIIKDQDHSNEFIETVYESGFYVNNLKEGVWEVYPDIDCYPNQIIAHRLFLHGTVIYETQYKRGKIHAIVSYGFKPRVGSSTTTIGVIYISELLLFNRRGKLIYRENISFDGVPERFFYNKKYRLRIQIKPAKYLVIPKN